MTIDLQKDEAQVLINLINIAVMAKGLEAAEAAAHFQRKISDAAKAADATLASKDA